MSIERAYIIIKEIILFNTPGAAVGARSEKFFISLTSNSIRLSDAANGQKHRLTTAKLIKHAT